MIISRSHNVLKRPLARLMSSKDALVDLSVDREGIALISMRRHPVNSFNLEMIQELSSAIDTVQKDRCKGFVLTSAARIFSAGFDLNEMNNPDLSRLRAFWSKYQDIFLQVYASGETTSTVAINGHTAAGACFLCLLCDYRVMVSDTKARIGINDTAVGIVPVPWVCEVMMQVIGHRQADIALTASTMFTVEDALKINLIDDTAADKEDAIGKCKEFIRRYDNIPSKVIAKTKRSIRQNTIKLVEMNREEDTKLFIQRIMDPNVQKIIDTYMQQLKSKKQ